MTLSGVNEIFSALNRTEVRYLVAGGLAVVAHGHVRLTEDIDLILDLQSPQLEEALKALAVLGYRPRPPVDLLDFADPPTRESWIEGKGMVVFQLDSIQYPESGIDVFARVPFDFDQEYEGALVQELSPEVSVSFVALETLLDMKRRAGRPKDLLDVDILTQVREEASDDATK